MRIPGPRTAAGAAPTIVLAIVVCTGLLSGCGDTETGSEPQAAESSQSDQPEPDQVESDQAEPDEAEPDQAEPDGERLSGEGYTIAMPDGWRDITASYEDSAFKIDNALKAPGDSPAGAGTNINVIREAPEGLPDLQTLEPQLAQQLRSVAKVEPQALEPTEIDGEPTIGQTATGTSAQGKLTFVQLFTIHDGALYSITLTSAPKSADAARNALDGVLASWSWE